MFKLGLDGIAIGDEMMVLTWLHEADRNVLRVHPRGDMSRPEAGVVSTRAPSRPNPIGLHRCTGARSSRAPPPRQPPREIDGTPIVDIKPVLGSIDER